MSHLSSNWRVLSLVVYLLCAVRNSLGQVQKCTAYSVSGTNNAQTGYATCSFTACPGVSYTISMCSNGGQCNGDTYLKLHDSANALVASNDNFCGKCSQITYLFTQGQCARHTIREGCKSATACSGTVVVVTTTNSPTLAPTSALPTTDPTILPTLLPTADPSTVPTEVPSVVPTPNPTAAPTLVPTAMPSSVKQRVKESPTWKVKSGYAFAAITTTGAAATWGRLTMADDPPVTDRVTKARVVIPADVVEITASRTAFVALLSKGAYQSWGAEDVIAGGTNSDIISTKFPTETSVQPNTFVASDAAFAGLNYEHSIVAFGAWGQGGNISEATILYNYSNHLTHQVHEITAAAGAFAALTWYRTVYTWGSPMLGAGVSSDTVPALVDVYKVCATRSAFAALLYSGRVLTWGDRYAGGNSTAVAEHLVSGVFHVIASQSVFVAFKNDGGLVTWGNAEYGGGYVHTAVNASMEVAFVAQTSTAFAAMTVDGSVVTWGMPSCGGESASVKHLLVDINAIYANNYAFAAVNQAGGVTTWGDAANGGVIPSDLRSSLSSGVVRIYSTLRAFAALKNDGSVVTWGNVHHGGDAAAAAPYLTSSVTAVCANDVAFTAILADGRAVVWGHSASVPYAGLLVNAPSFVGVNACA